MLRWLKSIFLAKANEEPLGPSICRECWHTMGRGQDQAWRRYMKCFKDEYSVVVDSVTGETDQYGVVSCATKNPRGNCQDYKQARPLPPLIDGNARHVPKPIISRSA